MPAMQRILSVAVLIAFVLLSLVAWIPSEFSVPVRGTVAGTQDPSHASWQIAVSANCNNRDVCGGEVFLGQPVAVGGIWGWMELDPAGGRAEFTACNGSSAPGPSPGDTIHVSVRITAWKVGPSGTFLILGGSEIVRGGAEAGSVLPILGPVDTGIRAMPGHYTSLLGSSLASAPGVHVEVQVVELSAD